ncbi:Zinc-type alcohol dehydrogenase-like protein [Vanrija pseudolonga]|uniref:Zinc-type alcohol dehydrogenase-like protein n=1 Tax=Vanrija pseudolonga TaxID=143232 RepID=A0AAF0Y7G7_9TREE|nr:Zinc-type alcohol dehydrogenase-like protein [Vanrija pseudolonga]
MKQYNLTHRTSLDGLVRRDDAPEPVLTGPNDILIRIKAIALNSRDLQVATGLYPAQHPIPDNVVPVSDGCGIVQAVGPAVTLFKVGDRVAPVFPQGHYFNEDLSKGDMSRGLGAGLHGVAQELFVCSEEDAFHIPKHFTYAEGATLPVSPPLYDPNSRQIAFGTAWSSLYAHNPKLRAGETVLCLGTGGVSLSAAQIALAAGARVIVTSSSAAKLDRARGLLTPLAKFPEDAIHTVDYSAIDDWDVEVRRLTGGRGVDFVIEIAGRATLGRSIRSTRQAGLVAVSGYVSAFGAIPEKVLNEDLAVTILMSGAYVRGNFVANREELKAMVSALELGGVKPIIDKTFTFDDLPAAYRYMADGKHFGKVVVEL